MTHVAPDTLMRFLDGELPPGEAHAVEAHLDGCSECARELGIYRGIKGDLQELSFAPPGGGSVWDEVNRRLAQPTGWALFLAGVLAYAIYAGYLFLTTPGDLWEKLATGGIVAGLALLLGSVIWERYREWETDPYREIHR